MVQVPVREHDHNPGQGEIFPSLRHFLKKGLTNRYQTGSFSLQSQSGTTGGFTAEIPVREGNIFNKDRKVKLRNHNTPSDPEGISSFACRRIMIEPSSEQ